MLKFLNFHAKKVPEAENSRMFKMWRNFTLIYGANFCFTENSGNLRKFHDNY